MSVREEGVWGRSPWYGVPLAKATGTGRVAEMVDPHTPSLHATMTTSDQWRIQKMSVREEGVW